MNRINSIFNNKRIISLNLYLYALMIFILSSLSFKSTSSVFHFKDKIIHFAEYGIFGYLLMKYFTAVRRKDPIRSAGLSVISGGLYALSDEIHQGFVGYFSTGAFGAVRDPDPFDFLADLAGIVIACVLFFALNKSFNFINNKTAQE